MASLGHNKFKRLWLTFLEASADKQSHLGLNGVRLLSGWAASGPVQLLSDGLYMGKCWKYKQYNIYRKISNIRRTKSTNLNATRLVLQLSLPSPMKPGVKSRMKM